jgi:hypothetical protein
MFLEPDKATVRTVTATEGTTELTIFRKIGKMYTTQNVWQ